PTPTEIRQPAATHTSLPSFPTRRSSDLFGAHEPTLLARQRARGRAVRVAGWTDAANARMGAASHADSRFVSNRSDDASRRVGHRDRKSTRLNSSHVAISYAVFCLKKKKE